MKKSFLSAIRSLRVAALPAFIVLRLRKSGGRKAHTFQLKP
jgi:hypothetical protein